MKPEEIKDLTEIQKQVRIVFDNKSYISKKSGCRGFVFSGKYSVICDGAWVYNTIIGNYSIIERGCQIGKATIFKGMFSNHYFCQGEGRNLFDAEYFCTNRFFYEKNPIIRIGNDVRICERSVIYSGVNIGDGAIVYPGSVVDSDVEPYTIVAGNPAKIIGKRFDKTIEQEIIKSKWFYKDISKAINSTRVNFLNTDYFYAILNNLDELPIVKDKCLEVDTWNNKISEFDYKTAVVGPSHVSNWFNLISQRKLPETPFFLYGESGLSLHGNTISSIIDLFIARLGLDVVLMVPDFRIGNACLVPGGDSENAKFIDPMFINEDDDKRIYKLSLFKIDELVRKYGKKIKFIFWCLYGREQTNIKARKYIINNEYRHPVWNYKNIVDRYKDNIIDISSLGERMLDLVENDGTIHPLPAGYDFLTKIIKDNLNN